MTDDTSFRETMLFLCPLFERICVDLIMAQPASAEVLAFIVARLEPGVGPVEPCSTSQHGAEWLRKHPVRTLFVEVAQQCCTEKVSSEKLGPWLVQLMQRKQLQIMWDGLCKAQQPSAERHPPADCHAQTSTTTTATKVAVEQAEMAVSPPSGVIAQNQLSESLTTIYDTDFFNDFEDDFLDDEL